MILWGLKSLVRGSSNGVDGDETRESLRWRLTKGEEEVMQGENIYCRGLNICRRRMKIAEGELKIAEGEFATELGRFLQNESCPKLKICEHLI